MYENINDYELLDMVCDNEMATEAIFEKYRPMIVSIAYKIYSKNQLYGVDLNDLVQEGMIGLSIAINTFNDNKDTSFYTFARLCIIRRIFSTLISNKRYKHQILNESLSVERITESEKGADVLIDDKNNPEELLLSDENMRELIKNIENVLTSFECEVFELKTAGFTTSEISEMLEKDKKSISNAIERIKVKLKNFEIM